MRVWILAFAGNTDIGETNKALTQPSPTGRGLIGSSPRPPGGEGLSEGVTSTPHPFILILSPSKDEDVPRTIRRSAKVWVPAFAGKTEEGENKAPFGPSGHFPQWEDFTLQDLPPLGEVPAKRG